MARTYLQNGENKHDFYTEFFCDKFGENSINKLLCTRSKTNTTMKQVHFILIMLLWSLSAYCQQAVQVKVAKPGTLSTLLTKTQQDTCQYLTVSGKLNSEDIKLLRQMAGASGCGQLRFLNLMEAKIVSSEEPYLTIRNAEKTVLPRETTERIMPKRIYWGGPTNDVATYASDDLPPVEESLYPGGEIKEISHANYILLGGDDKTLSEQATSQNMSQWKKMTKQKLNVKGHSISREKDGHYTYSAFTRKNLFCEDMFYLCPNLQMVILPSKGKTYDRVVIPGDPIRYKAAKAF